MILVDGRNPTNSNESLVLLGSSLSRGSLELFLINPCNLKSVLFLNWIWVFPSKKKSKQHFRYPFLIPWKCFMAENHWKSALLNLHFCRKEKYLPISRRSSGSRSGSKLKPPQKVFSPKKKMVRIVWTVQSPRYLTFPSFYVSPFERSADRTWFQFLVWPGQCNTSQPGKRHKKPGEYFAAWKKNLVVDTLSQWNDTTWLLILIS